MIEAIGLSEFAAHLALAPKIATESARIALNQTAERKGLKLAQEAMLSQVAFPRGYLSGSDGSGERRFRVSKRAQNTDLEAHLRGRFSPTSLSRFATGRPEFVGGRFRRGSPIQVRVNPARVRTLEHSFFIQLRNGNIGLGVRIRNGETLTNTTGAKLITSGPLRGVALLYGPSVDQVCRTVAVDISPALLQELTVEFMRQFAIRFNANK